MDTGTRVRQLHGVLAERPLAQLRPDLRQRLDHVARLEPGALLGVVEYWLTNTMPEGRDCVDA